MNLLFLTAVPELKRDPALLLPKVPLTTPSALFPHTHVTLVPATTVMDASLAFFFSQVIETAGGGLATGGGVGLDVGRAVGAVGGPVVGCGVGDRVVGGPVTVTVPNCFFAFLSTTEWKKNFPVCVKVYEN